MGQKGEIIRIWPRKVVTTNRSLWMVSVSLTHSRQFVCVCMHACTCTHIEGLHILQLLQESQMLWFASLTYLPSLENLMVMTVPRIEKQFLCWVDEESFESPVSWWIAQGTLDGAMAWASLVAQTIKNAPAVWKTWVQSPGWEDPLKEGIQPTPVFLPGESHGQRNLVGYSPWRCKELDTAKQLNTDSTQPELTERSSWRGNFAPQEAIGKRQKLFFTTYLHVWVYSMDPWVQNSQMRENPGASYTRWHLASQGGTVHSCGSPRGTLGTATHRPAIVQVHLTGGRHSHAGRPPFKSMTTCSASVTTSDHSPGGSPWSCPADNTSHFKSISLSPDLLEDCLRSLPPPWNLQHHLPSSLCFLFYRENKRSKKRLGRLTLHVPTCGHLCFKVPWKSQVTLASLLSLRKGSVPQRLTHGSMLPLPLLGLHYHRSQWDLLAPKF